MQSRIAIQAARDSKRLQISYNGFVRVVEVHTVGTTTAGNEGMRVWQVRGGSQSGETAGWKMLRFDEAGPMNILDEASEAPREGYKKGDKGFNVIVFEI
ncbi:hypothetical protein [Methyloraptor flagellatus]|uniref:WYL domain-containing protein n=1 Tax=Methyloraptor flagellatus TaxID=3162530 RepID=A0AAU7X637_9HYPH